MSGRYAAVVAAALVVLAAATGGNSIRDLIVAAGVFALGAVTLELIRYWYDVLAMPRSNPSGSNYQILRST